MRKRIVPVLIALGLVGLLIYQLRSEAAVECRACLTFNGLRRCVTAVGPNQNQARAEAMNNICAQLAKGVTESVACGKLVPEEESCKAR